ncbi:DNA-binding TFAR19-related protein [Piromyces finnis]|uniref:DNA-binding TFAR19-related protein n=1 Tax=Piromyces finnis TaxID=1754191 RepID=A0A1Y1VJL2_9FUNG|nr:DNA-binding TFAR19-related protein [Piromyces finnis]|eukprot:ORX57864.1 DNA-binding TFAR19-related protein [Piromyces finnis]
MGGGFSGERSSGGDDEEKKNQIEDMRRNMLAQVLDNSARERISRIAIVKPEKARAVEDYILGMARSGRLASKINESQLIDLLEQMNETKKETKIVYNRRRYDDSDSDEDYGF